MSRTPIKVQRFNATRLAEQDTDKIHLLFNNAGVGGGGVRGR